MRGIVLAVAGDREHNFAKPVREAIVLVPGIGVVGDAHSGPTVQHRSRLKRTPDAPNLRQVHLIPAELFDELAQAGFTVGPGQLGENLTTRGIDLLDLPKGARLRLGTSALLEVTGLRNPCWQIDAFSPGLLAEMIEKRPDGSIMRKCGLMGVVETGGTIGQGAHIAVDLPPEPHRPLDLV